MAPRQTNAEMSEATRAELISKARGVFAQYGYHQAPIEEVVRACGLTRGALYHHFGSKQGLFVAVVASVERELLARVDRDLQRPQPRRRGERSDAAIEHFLRACRSYLEATMAPDIRQILLVDAPAVWAAAAAAGNRDAELARAEQDAFAPLVAALEELRQEGFAAAVEPTVTARMLGGALFEAAQWLATQPRTARALDTAMRTLTAMVQGVAQTR